MSTNNLPVHISPQRRRHRAADFIGQDTEIQTSAMLCSRCVLPFLAFYLWMEEIRAAVLPSRERNTREVHWLDQELFPHRTDHLEGGDLSLGDAGDVGTRRAQEETLVAPTEHLPPVQHQNQYQYHRRNTEKRRKVAPLDAIGSFTMSNSRNRKDKPEVYVDDHRA